EVTWRDYLHDAAFLVGLAGDDPELLRCLKQHLESPKWPVYLGRKACVPTRPLLDSLTAEYDSLEDAISNAPWSAPLDVGTRRAIAHTFKPDELPKTLRDWPKVKT